MESSKLWQRPCVLQGTQKNNDYDDDRDDDDDEIRLGSFYFTQYLIFHLVYLSLFKNFPFHLRAII